MKTENPDEVSKAGVNKKPSLSTRQRWFWRIVAVFSFVWIFLPEATDLFFPLGWIDEGVAFFLLSYSLGKLGVKLPFLKTK